MITSEVQAAARAAEEAVTLAMRLHKLQSIVHSQLPVFYDGAEWSTAAARFTAFPKGTISLVLGEGGAPVWLWRAYSVTGEASSYEVARRGVERACGEAERGS